MTLEDVVGGLGDTKYIYKNRNMGNFDLKVAELIVSKLIVAELIGLI